MTTGTRNHRHILARGLCGFALLTLQGCALFSKGDPVVTRHFSLDRPPRASASAAPGETAPASPRATLRLGRITADDHLEERVVLRGAASEIGYARGLRWTEPPALSLRRMLSRGLFEERGVQQVTGGPGPTLEVELTAFDAQSTAPRQARARVTARLLLERRVLWEKTLTVEAPVSARADGDHDLETIETLAQVLQSAADQIAEHVADQIAAQHPDQGAAAPAGGP